MIAWERQAISVAVCDLRRSVEVAQQGGAPILAAEGRAKLAVVLSYAGDDVTALREAAAAEAVLTGRMRAELQHHVAGILKRQGRVLEASHLQTTALRSFRRHGDILWQAKALNNRAVMFAELGRVASGRRDLETAESLYRQLGMTLGTLKVRNNLAWLASLRGDVPAALSLHGGLAGELEAIGVPPGLFRLDHATVLLVASLPGEARVMAERAAAELRAEGMAADSAEALLLASTAACLAGAFDAAEDLGRQAATIFEEQHREVWTLRARHAVLEATWRAGRHHDGMEQMARNVAADLDAAGWTAWAGEVHILVGKIALATGDHRTAAAALAAARARRARTPGYVAQVAALEAELHAAKGDIGRARRAVRGGLRKCEAQEATLGSTELRVKASRHAAELAELSLRWAVESGRATDVLTWAERRRAAALRTSPVRPPRDRQMARLLAARRGATFAVEQQAASRDFTVGPDPVTIRHLANLDAQIRDLARSRRGVGAVIDSPRFHFRALANALGKRALVEFVVVDRQLSAITIVDGTCNLHLLGSVRDVEGELDFVRFALGRIAVSAERRGVAGLIAGLARLDELLLTPLSARVFGRELVVVPIATLHTVPWAALPSAGGHPVTIAPSATTWLAAATRTCRRRAPVVMVAGPGLEHGDAEVAAVGRIAGATQTLTGPSATSARVAQALSGARLAHLACHGRFRSDNPMFSSLELADGPLTVYELERLHQAPHLIVLSACDSAVGSPSAGDELMGLTASLLALGASTLIGAVAPVRDDHARPLMLAFHKYLATGQSPATALASARRSTSDDDPRAYATGVAFGCFGAGAPAASQ